MPTFVLTAQQHYHTKTGQHIQPGQQITVNIFKDNVTPYNLLGVNHKWDNDLVQQFRMNGIDAPRTDGVYGRSLWRVELK